jgi:hypothetical protein
LTGITVVAGGLPSLRLVLSTHALITHSEAWFVLIPARRASDALVVIVLRILAYFTRLAASYSREFSAFNLALNVGGLPSITIVTCFTVSDRDGARRAVFASNVDKECGLIEGKRQHAALDARHSILSKACLVRDSAVDVWTL